MPNLNPAARNFMADASGDLCGTGSLVLMNGATVLATHAMAGFTAGADGVQNANPIADVAPVASGLVNAAKIVNGAMETSLAVGTEIILDDYDLVQGGNSKVTSITIIYPAS